MSERLAATEDESLLEEGSAESWPTGDHYSYMKVDVGTLGSAMYFSLPAFTILAKTEEEISAINDDFSVPLSKYTDQLIVGNPHEASLILSLNQASADLATQANVITFLREKIKELTGSYDEAGDWEDEK